MKFAIEDKILKSYASLPEVFKLKDLMDKAGMTTVEYPLVSQQLKRMAELQIVHKSGERKWFKNFSTIDKWLKAWLEGKVIIEEEPELLEERQ